MSKITDLINEIVIDKNIESGKELCKSKIFKFDWNISCEHYEIVNESQVKLYNKPKGVYDLISLGDVLYLSNEEKEYISQILFKRLSKILKVNKSDKILVVGLGNRHISSDSLGVNVVRGINITFERKSLPKVMAICPSVMGLTGIETSNIVDGVIDKVRPNILILIDSLCASNISRLGRSIQITNNGICPGSGIGNNRKCIGNNFKGKIISIGVPLLIYASTFITNTFNEYGIDFTKINSIMQDAKKTCNMEEINSFITNVKNVYLANLDNTIVSIKDISECVETLSQIISSAVNKVLGVDSIK